MQVPCATPHCPIRSALYTVTVNSLQTPRIKAGGAPPQYATQLYLSNIYDRLMSPGNPAATAPNSKMATSDTATITGELPSSSRPPRYYALLIGINAYTDKPLKGCVNDVHMVKSILDDQPYDVEVRTLTATKNEGKVGSGQLPPFAESAPDLATWANVDAALLEIMKDAAPGDSVYIHYSGHGMYESPSQNQENHVSNRLTGDLALALLNDKNPTAVKPLTGHFLAVKLNVMIRKRVIVTVVLDCCFSATVYRDDGIRYLPSGHDEADDRHPGHDRDEHRTLRSVAQPDEIVRGVSMEPSWKMNPECYSILTAAGPREIGPEIRIGDQHFGKLSYFLCKLFEQGNDLSMRQTTVFRHLRSRYFAEFKEHGAHTPCLYGNKQLPFFGPALDTKNRTGNGHAGTDKADIPVVKDPKGNLIILAGEAQGLLAGDKVDVYAYGRGTPAAQLSILNVKTTGVTTSLLEPAAEPGLAARAAPTDNTDLFARVRTQQRLGDYPVRLDMSLGDLPRWKSELSSLGLAVAGSTDAYRFHLTVARGEETTTGSTLYRILDASGREYANLPPLPLVRTDINDVVSIIHHLAKYAMVFDLSNSSGKPSSGPQRPRLKDSFELLVETSTGTHRAGQLIELQETGIDFSEVLKLSIRNNGTRDLFVYVYALSPQTWEVQHVHHTTFEVALPARDVTEPEYSTTLLKRLRLFVPQQVRDSGAEYCEDTIKVFVTSHWTSFDPVELSNFWAPQKKEPEHWRQNNPWNVVRPDEDWEGINFSFRTKIRR